MCLSFRHVYPDIVLVVFIVRTYIHQVLFFGGYHIAFLGSIRLNTRDMIDGGEGIGGGLGIMIVCYAIVLNLNIPADIISLHLVRSPVCFQWHEQR